MNPMAFPIRNIKPLFRLVGAAVGLLALAGPLAIAAETTAPADITAQLQKMNDADCATSKSGDWDAFAKTLAPEFVVIDVVGKKQSRADLVADLKATSSAAKVTACSTKVSRVTREGESYHLYGEYSEEGQQGPKHASFRTLSRIRDTWKRADGAWLQTESLTYEMTVWVSGKLVEHRVLPAQR
jgi:hypothetical protein